MRRATGVGAYELAERGLCVAGGAFRPTWRVSGGNITGIFGMCLEKAKQHSRGKTRKGYIGVNFTVHPGGNVNTRQNSVSFGGGVCP